LSIGFHHGLNDDELFFLMKQDLMEWSASLYKRLQMSQDVSNKQNIKIKERQTVDNNSSKGRITVLGIDLAKNSFQLHGVDEKGNRVLKKKLTRNQLVAFIAQLPLV